MNNLFRDFLLSKNELREFFPWLPVDGIEKINNHINGYISREKTNNISPAIITGQQPAVFGGPLYTFYKIATSIKLSLLLYNRYGNKIKPVFWVHSWDHDWEEVCSTNFLTYNYEIFPFKFNPDNSEKGKPLYKLKLDKNCIQKQIPGIFKNIKGSEFTSQWQDFLLNSLTSADTLSDWSLNILKRIFKDENLYWYEPHQTNDFKILQEIIEISIDNHSLLFDNFNKTTNLLKEMGYKPQVHKLPDNAFFFLEENDYRSKITFQNGIFYSEISKKEYTASEIKHILHYEPERFSPNLLLRCIYQQMIFPGAVYIGGPAEVAYWAQLKDLFKFFKLPMPIVYPRSRFILLPIKIKKWLSELNIDIHTLTQTYDKKKEINSHIISNSQNNEIEKAKTKFINNANLFFDDLTAIFDNNSLENYRKTYLSKIEIETQKLIDNFIKSQRNKNEIFQKRLYHISNTILPNGFEQERFFSTFSFIPEYNDNFIKIIMNKIDISDFDLGIIEL